VPRQLSFFPAPLFAAALFAVPLFAVLMPVIFSWV
jgi:hypothetical protein